MSWPPASAADCFSLTVFKVNQNQFISAVWRRCMPSPMVVIKEKMRFLRLERRGMVHFINKLCAYGAQEEYPHWYGRKSVPSKKLQIVKNST